MEHEVVEFGTFGHLGHLERLGFIVFWGSLDPLDTLKLGYLDTWIRGGLYCEIDKILKF
jgi:hypothetical protein